MRLFSLLLFLSFSLSAAFAQQELLRVNGNSKPNKSQLNQKIKMAKYILNSSSLLNRLQASNDNVASELVARAKDNLHKIEAYMNGKQFLEAGAVIDFVLRDLSASSQLLNISSQLKKKYQTVLEKLEAFVLPEWKNITEIDRKFLQDNLTRINELRNDAIIESQSEAYDEAIKLLDTAYFLKLSLINELQHENTVIYDLNFDSEQEEYLYLFNRTYHYLDLVDLTLSKKEINFQARKLADDTVYLSMVNLEVAQDMESEGKLSEAIHILGKSINQLSSVLKLLGIKI